MSKRKPVLTEADFWLPKPSALGWRGISLLLPALASALGFFCFAVLAFSFTELEMLPEGFRRGIVILGAFTLAFGSEIGTLSNVIEIYRKGEQRQTWDWIGLGISLIATCAAFLLAFAALLGVKATWGVTVQLYGPIVLGILAALDSYGGFMEFGLYLNTHDARMKEWQDAFRQAILEAVELEQQAAHGLYAPASSAAPPPLATLPPVLELPEPPVQPVTPPPAVPDKRVRLDNLLSLYAQEPHAGASEVARRLGISRTTVYTYLTELEAAGAIRRNGEGVQVLANV